MLKQMRLRAGVYLSALLLFAGVALVASGAPVALITNAATPVTRSEMEVYFWERMSAGGGVLFLAVWTLLQSKTSRIEQMLDKLADGQSVMKDALSGLIAEHKMIRENEEDVCAVLRMRRDDTRKSRHNDPENLDVQSLRQPSDG